MKNLIIVAFVAVLFLPGCRTEPTEQTDYNAAWACEIGVVSLRPVEKPTAPDVPDGGAVEPENPGPQLVRKVAETPETTCESGRCPVEQAEPAVSPNRSGGRVTVRRGLFGRIVRTRR